MKITVLVLAVCAFVLVGCNTVEGMGKDIKKAGQEIEKAAK